MVASRLIDLAITFGLDLDASRSLAQRVPSALVAADEAARDGKRWASFNPASMEDADWAMSLLGRLDHAIDNRELWVAYQPKLDCKTGLVTGTEALVAGTPEKACSTAIQRAAERGGRIERLTYFVLDDALAAAATANRRGQRFTIAVNLSVLLLNSDELVPTVEALLRKHEVEPALLTLEVTETSTLGSAADQIANLQRLSDMGVELSIDDYGNGFHLEFSADPRFGEQDRPPHLSECEQFAERRRRSLDDTARHSGSKVGQKGRERGDVQERRDALRNRPGLYIGAGPLPSCEGDRRPEAPKGAEASSRVASHDRPRSAGLF